ncbi:hypothetical protein FACS1894109_03310 [Spirochaetia bacterium]|nr:hypothetical protein FACS1894109_03310 [Spirochaetia bacterium]
MKQNKFFVAAMLGMVLTFGLVFLGCDNDNGGGGDDFTASTNESTANDVATLGLIGTGTPASSAPTVATAVINSGKIKITSESAGTAVITVSDASGHTSTIAVTVAVNGSITIGTITKYDAVVNHEINIASLSDVSNHAGIKDLSGAFGAVDANDTFSLTSATGVNIAIPQSMISRGTLGGAKIVIVYNAPSDLTADVYKDVKFVTGVAAVTRALKGDKYTDGTDVYTEIVPSEWTVKDSITGAIVPVTLSERVLLDFGSGDVTDIGNPVLVNILVNNAITAAGLTLVSGQDNTNVPYIDSVHTTRETRDGTPTPLTPYAE